MDMPVNLQQAFANIDIAKIQQAVEDYGPAIEVVRGTWDHATLQEIADGKLFVSDDMMNEAIAKQVAAQGDDAPVTSVVLKSHENGRLDITADTKKLGPVELSGTIEEFVHDGDQSLLKYHVRSKNIPQHGLMSWVFSRISLSMADRAVCILDTIISQYPGFEDIGGCYFLKGYAFETAEQFDSARTAYTYFVENYPDHPLAADTRRSLDYLGMTPEEMLEAILANAE